MKTAIFKKPGLIAVEDHPKPTIQQPTDAVMRVVRACMARTPSATRLSVWWRKSVTM